jgi:hypothetical protein
VGGGGREREREREKGKCVRECSGLCVCLWAGVLGWEHEALKSMPVECAWPGAYFPGSIFDWLIAVTFLQGFVLPLVLAWAIGHVFALFMTKEAAANCTSRVAPNLLTLSGIYLCICGVMMYYDGISKVCP